MIYSMTGYAAASRKIADGGLSLELRSVNHRYLDVQFRMPEELRGIESAVREQISSKIVRGKVECRIGFAAQEAAPRSLQLNHDLARQLFRLDAEARAIAPEAKPLGVADILRWPGMLGGDTPDLDRLRTSCQELLRDAISEFNGSRAREGDKLKNMLLERVEKMEKLGAEVAPRIPQLIASYREKLGARLREALVDAEDDRMRQELVLFAARIDVDEELSRLGAHLSEVRRVLDKGGAVGKRLDFLMQELNREANTLGSKSVDVDVTRTSMELKVLIEQMREQIQNIE